MIYLMEQIGLGWSGCCCVVGPWHCGGAEPLDVHGEAQDRAAHPCMGPDPAQPAG